VLLACIRYKHATAVTSWVLSFLLDHYGVLWVTVPEVYSLMWCLLFPSKMSM
jgi:hypothetical protein